MDEKAKKDVIFNREISDFTLSVRSRHCLSDIGVKGIRDLVKLTEGRLLRQRNFGRRSLREIKELLDQLGLHLGMSDRDIENFKVENPSTPNHIISKPPKKDVFLDHDISGFTISVRSRNCLNDIGVKKIRDLIKLTEAKLLKQRNFGRKSLREINDLLDQLGLHLGMGDPDIEIYQGEDPSTPNHILSKPAKKTDSNALFKAIPWMAPIITKLFAHMVEDAEATVGSALGVKNLAGAETKIIDVFESVGFKLFGAIYDEVYNMLRDHQKFIVSQRTYAYPPKSLEQLGLSLDLSRERIRQIEKKVRRFLDHRLHKKDIHIQSRVFRAMLGKVVPVESAKKLSRTIVSSSENAEQAFNALVELAGPYTMSGGWLIRSDTLRRVANQRASFVQLADRIGRVDPLILSRVTAGLFRRDSERDRFLIEHVKLHRIFEEWMVSKSQRRRVLLSLYKIGRPATKEEIAKHSGVCDLMRIGSYLTSFDFICRADKDRWAFIEWVENPYDGISNEIEELITEDGGSTSVDKIIQEIPRNFNVAENSVRAYLTTPRFVAENGFVRLATKEEINNTYFGDVEDVQTAVRLEDGCWAARIRIEENFFNGYSAGIPAAIAWECGLKPGDSLLVPVEGTNHEVSLIWRLNNLLQTVDFGRIAPVLHEMGLKRGDEIVVALSMGSVRVFKASEAPIKKNGNQGESDPAPIESLIKALFKK